VDTATDQRVVTVKPGPRQVWLVSIEGRNSDLPFSARHLAIDFARAYAKLRRAGSLQVFNEKNVLEREERVDFNIRRDREDPED
jgi:hypothetical protein